MTLKELSTIRRKYFDEYHPYKLVYWSNYDYKVLDNILYRKKAGRGENTTYNDVIIMCDTETSKKHENTTYIAPDGTTKYNQVDNYIVAWTISLRAFNRNIVTLYGNTPNEFCHCIQKIIGNMNGYETIFYWHNMAYDWTFIRRFMFNWFGFPDNQLNTKPHYPILIRWDNGITFKDSLILAQRSLDKWAKDLDVEHKKAKGKWDYDKIRTQHETFTAEELEYIEHDTLAGVECLDKMRITLNKSIYSMPYTATGIPRGDIRKLGKENAARDSFKRQVLTFDQYLKLERVYHGGYTHANRHFIDVLISSENGGFIQGFDFASSYPYVMLAYKYPSESFTKIGDKDYHYIIEHSENYAFMFKLILIKPNLKENVPMPALQFSKCVQVINPVLDNGRILCADYVEIYLTDIDLEVIVNQYNFQKHICCEVEVSKKDYLPKWFTDYIFGLFKDKTMLKGGDPVLYALKKAILNSVYGMCVQNFIKDDIVENYVSGEYIKAMNDGEEIYNKYISKPNTILPYQWGVWVTAYAFRNLFTLGACCGTWLYSDTDSCYGYDWNIEKVREYNDSCKKRLQDNGYCAVIFNDREWWLGVAEHKDGEDDYTEFKVLGAKRYCGRCVEDGELHITVAGVPKCGVVCLKNDINNFTKGTIFDGITTGKLTHTYHYVDDIYTDENGNVIGDSIDLTPCDYKLDRTDVVDFEALLTEEIEVQVYEETTIL